MYSNNTLKMRARLLVGVGMVALSSVAAFARVVDLDLPQQTLSDSLSELSRRTGENILFQPDAVTGIKAPAVSGRMGARDAVQRLLQGTSLKLRTDSSGGIIIQRESFLEPVRERAAAVQVAQAAPTAPVEASPNVEGSAPSAVEQVTVTGTRVLRNGYQAPTPLTVIGADQISQAAPANLADFVNQMPELAGSATPQTANQSYSAGTAGLSNMNLRSLGAVRTLVLLDGHRSVGSTQTGLVDINTFPQELISRVDIVTGGASAAYGSDAVAGVVNYVLDKDYTGIKGKLSGGISTYGDAPGAQLSLTGGTNFANGRGHFLVSGELVHNDTALSGTRAWNNTGTYIIVNPAYSAKNTSVPQWEVVNHAQVDTATFGGIITAGPLRGTAFGQGGAPYQFTYGSIVSDPWTVGGNWSSNQFNTLNSMAPQEDRQGVFTRASYSLSDDVNVYLQYSYNNSRYVTENTYAPYLGNLSIKADNAFMPASIAQQVHALGISSFSFGKTWSDLGALATQTERNVQRFVAGGNGAFDVLGTTWTWDGYVQHGVTHATEGIANIVSTDKLTQAIDSVYNPAGQIVCRSNLTGGNPGCVPLNPFGTNVASADAINYVDGSPYRKETFSEDEMSFSLSGEPFSIWAGPVSLATGIEHRMEGVNGYVPPQYQSGWYAGNYLATVGHYSVTEGFIETVVPLARDESWARSLDLNAAARFTDYSTSGFVITSKVGATYQITDDLRLRATRSRDIRAPNLSELYNNGVYSNGFAQDPRNGFVNVPAFGLTTGNADLKPEVADTTGLGMVYQPSFLPGFGFSVDYYNIALNGAISTISAQQIINQCYVAQQQQYCAAITPNPSGPGFTRVLIEPFNLNTLKARGLDFEANYNVSASDIIDGWNGNLSIRGLATNYIENLTSYGIPGVPALNTAGTNGGSGPPHWRFNVTGIYSNEPFTVGLTARGASQGKLNDSYIQCTTGCPIATVNNETINNNQLPGTFYFDVNLSYEFMKGEDGVGSVFFNVSNLLDAAPAVVPVGPSGLSQISQGTNPYLYDELGRFFRLGVRFNM